jgi:hypothetical protein
MIPTVDYFVSNYGMIRLSPWLATRAYALPTRKNGRADMRFKVSKRYFRRMAKLARARYMADIDG